MSMGLADRLSAIVFFALGMALLLGGWTMDRLEVRQIHPASIPGLLPMILGVLLVICAVLLMISTFSKSAEADNVGEMVFFGGSWSRLFLTAITCCIYALGLIGTLDYTLATLLFTAVFTLVFSFPFGAEQRAQVIAVAGALILSLFVSVGSAVMFSELFLVRLP